MFTISLEAAYLGDYGIFNVIFWPSNHRQIGKQVTLKMHLHKTSNPLTIIPSSEYKMHLPKTINFVYIWWKASLKLKPNELGASNPKESSSWYKKYFEKINIKDSGNWLQLR